MLLRDQRLDGLGRTGLFHSSWKWACPVGHAGRMMHPRRMAAACALALVLAAACAQTPVAPATTSDLTAPSPAAAVRGDEGTTSTAPASAAPAGAESISAAPARTTPASTAPAGTAQPGPQENGAPAATDGAPDEDSVINTPESSGEFTLAVAGDVNFAEQTADLLAKDPATALREAADQLSAADITMVNLETAITEGGSPAPKQFHFRAPATALDALAAGGVDVATMANNHAVDYGDAGLADSLAAIASSPIPVLGIGADADAAYAPWITTVNGVRVGFLAASQVHDWTLATHTATASAPGIASAAGPRLIAATKKLARQVDVVVVYLHWGIEFESCPSGEQRALADQLAAAGATAIVGTHVHLLQGAGWRDDGVYVAYGLGNYYWWRSFGNQQDDNGVLTLTFSGGRVVAADFLATRLDSRGVPQIATGAQRKRIETQWERDRQCAGLADSPPGS